MKLEWTLTNDYGKKFIRGHKFHKIIFEKNGVWFFCDGYSVVHTLERLVKMKAKIIETD